MANAIQDNVNKEIATIPLFYGEKEKDTITLTTYIERIDQGVTALEWTDAQAYIYFSNTLKGTAADWLVGHLIDNDNIAKHWSIMKPALRLAFNDITDHTIFAKDMGKLKIGQFDGNLLKYYAAIAKSMSLHMEQFAAVPLTLPAAHGLNAEQVVLCQNEVAKATKHIHDVFRKEFFISGLTKAQVDKISNKPELTTAGQMLTFLKRTDEISKRQVEDPAPAPAPTPAPAAAAKIYPVPEDEEEMAAFAAFTAQRQAFRGQQNGRGNGNGRGRGHFHKAGNGGNGGNGGQKQDAAGKPNCIFCKATGHRQEKCYKRIAENAPCIDQNGRNFFPKSAQKQNSVQPDDVEGGIASVSPHSSVFH